MTVREIVIFPDQRLREKASLVTEFDEDLNVLAQDMAETMYAFNGIGLAATQVGISRRVVVMDTQEGKELRILVNPEVVAVAKDSHLVEEGCLSFPDIFEKVSRSLWVRVKAQMVCGTEILLELSGLNAQCVQHEIEHLNGVVLVDNLGRTKRRWITKNLQKRKKRKNLRYAVPNPADSRG